MRFESVSQLLGELKRNYFEPPLAILTLCKRVNLSYQPTYAHIRALEAQGVVQTLKQGRKVVCRLTASPQTANWLALTAYSAARKRLESRPGGAYALQALVDEAFKAGGVVAFAYLLPESTALRLLVVAENWQPREKPADVELEIVAPSDFFDLLVDPAEPKRLLAEALPIVGGEEFYRLLLTSESKVHTPVVAPGSPLRRRRPSQRRKASTRPETTAARAEGTSRPRAPKLFSNSDEFLD